MPGKAHIPDLFERLLRGQRAGTSRTAGGFARGASPQMTRDRIGASLKGGGLLGTTARSSKVDWFEIVDDSESSFTLSHVPITDSWNVQLNSETLDDEDEIEFQIVGKTLTITDPTDTFRGADTQGSPWKMRVQYDYLTGVPATPLLEVVGTGHRVREAGVGDTTAFWMLGYDDSAWTLQPTDEIAYSGGTFPAQTYSWPNSGADMQVRCFITATPGAPLTLTYGGPDDSMDVYWNESLILSVGFMSGTHSVVIPGSSVLANNLIGVRASNNLGGPGRGFTVDVAP